MFQGPYTKVKFSPRGDIRTPGSIEGKSVLAEQVEVVSASFTAVTVQNQVSAGRVEVTANGLLVNGASEFIGSYLERAIDLGTVPNGSSTVTVNLSLGNFFFVDFSGSDAAGTVTFSFTNIPVTTNRIFTWQLEIRQGGRKSRAWPGDIQWDDNGAPAFTNTATKTDLLTFYRVLGRSKTYAMLARTGTI